jgi:hypothetical protein
MSGTCAYICLKLMTGLQCIPTNEYSWMSSQLPHPGKQSNLIECAEGVVLDSLLTALYRRLRFRYVFNRLYSYFMCSYFNNCMTTNQHLSSDPDQSGISFGQSTSSHHSSARSEERTRLGDRGWAPPVIDVRRPGRRQLRREALDCRPLRAPRRSPRRRARSVIVVVFDLARV